MLGIFSGFTTYTVEFAFQYLIQTRLSNATYRNLWMRITTLLWAYLCFFLYTNIYSALYESI